MILLSAAVLIAIILLIYSSDYFVEGSSAIAIHLGVSPLIIGITIIGFGTSAPEMLVSAIAAANGKPGMAVGNALGSDITNIALVLGLTAVFIPLKVSSGILRKELPILLVATLIVYYLLADQFLSAIDGLIMFFLLFACLFWFIRTSRIDKTIDPLITEIEQEVHDMPLAKSFLITFIALLVLVAASKLFVWGASGIAQALGISDLVIGLTIVALGTSLPELSASLAAAKKNEHDLAIGNVIGSNLFNTLGVLALPGILSPAALDAHVLSRDLPMALLLIVLLFIMAFRINNRPSVINRLEGAALVIVFIIYDLLLFNII